MRLNPDCIRDILLYVEDMSNGVSKFIFDDIEDEFKENKFLKSYSPDEIKYHFKQAYLSDFLIGYEEYIYGEFAVKDLSPKGHNFLANIRSDTIWNKTKEKAKEVGSNSLTTLVNIASQIIVTQIGSI